LNLLVSNGIIFVLYNLCFVSQIDNLEIHVGPLNWNGGSIFFAIYNLYYVTQINDLGICVGPIHPDGGSMRIWDSGLAYMN
jgi:hypothetical protein